MEIYKNIVLQVVVCVCVCVFVFVCVCVCVRKSWSTTLMVEHRLRLCVHVDLRQILGCGKIYKNKELHNSYSSQKVTGMTNSEKTRRHRLWHTCKNLEISSKRLYWIKHQIKRKVKYIVSTILSYFYNCKIALSLQVCSIIRHRGVKHKLQVLKRNFLLY